MVIATPTAEHASGLEWAVAHCVPAYVEKPLAARADGLRTLLEQADATGIAVATGYNLRFHPALEAIRAAIGERRIGRVLSVRAEVGQYLPDWQPGADYRRSYAAQALQGGGALLTLSHELDYVRWIAGEVETCNGIVARTSSLELDADDVVELTCLHASGAVSSVHADFVDRAYNRRTRWVGDDGTLEWTWGGAVTLLPDGEQLWRDDGYDFAQTYERALADFLAAAASGGSPRCTGWDGLRVLELCEAVTR